ncbi:MAG: polysaccharide pyruvyl transferase family protein [Candidatus Acidiferrales bacterium]
MMDLLLEAWVSGLAEYSKVKWMMGAGERWRPGRKLRLLLAGYNGTRNTGSDLRVEEIVRQVKRILGPENVALSVMSQNFENSKGYFEDARQLHLPDVYPPFLFREAWAHDGVVACEGSMFKSKFANALTTMMIGALGIAAAQNKLSVGFGGDADEMDATLARMCRRYCRDSLIITRSKGSQEALGKIGVHSELGTDTAWTFEPRAPEYGEKTLRDAGWDGRAKVMVLCPINPFWWPVNASLWKWFAHATAGTYKKTYYRTIYFHRGGRAVDEAYEKYLNAFARAADRYKRERGAFVIVVGMERLDREACARLGEKLGGAPVFTSERYDMYELVSILRRCDRMVSSRYHAIVTSMPAGVPSAGVTMDERIRGLMLERGHAHLMLKVNEADLDEKIFTVMEALDREADSVRCAIQKTVVNHLRTMARMGVLFEERVARTYPEFPIRSGRLSWEDYIPPLSPPLRRLMESCG